MDIEVEFEADPEPDEVIWRMQVSKGRETEVEAGDTERDYESFELEEEGRDTYVASMTITEVSDDDLNVPNNHELEVKNDAGTTVFKITLVTEDCEKDDDDSDEDSDEEYQCDLDDDRDCFCDGTGRSRQCCSQGRNCEPFCCDRCSSRERSNKRVCKYCDKRERTCMKLKDDSDEDDDDDDDSDEQCDLDDKDCRCDGTGRSRKCCDASRNCDPDKDDNCCASCDRDEKDNKRICKFCDSRKRNCMKLADSDEDSSDESFERCDPKDRDCRCDSTRSSRKCCDNSRNCDHDQCCDRCSSRERSNKRICRYCNDDGDDCMKLREGSDEDSSILDSDEQCDLEDEKDCRCDGTGRSRKCCDASDDCEGDLCCVDCDRDERNDKKVCKFCDERKRNCMKLDDSSSGGSSSTILDSNEQCDLDDEKDCRCDGTGSRRECCDASDDCEGDLCCVDCDRDERNDKKVCKFCDERKRNCMKLDDSSSRGGSSSTILDSNEQCDLDDEKDCRCDGTGSRRECCDASDDCDGDLCCVDCDRDERNDKKVCKFCDDRKRNCMKLDDSRSGGSDESIEGKRLKDNQFISTDINRRSDMNVCHLRKVTGPCRAHLKRFFFDNESRNCDSFTYGGCDGNGNNFDSLDECNRVCGEGRAKVIQGRFISLLQ